MKINLALLVVLFGLTGCGALYEKRSQEFLATQPESAWGARPPADHIEMERALTLARLKDPESARIEVSGVLMRSVVPAGATDPTVIPVFCSYQSVNAKNSYGGYTGAERWEYCYRNGRLFSVVQGKSARIYLD